MSDAPEAPGAFRAYNGHVVHLYTPGYQPGIKTRSTPAAMCGANAWGTSSGPLVWYPEPRPVLGAPLRWCAKCVGCALEHAGLLSSAVRDVAPYFTGSVDSQR